MSEKELVTVQITYTAKMQKRTAVELVKWNQEEEFYQKAETIPFGEFNIHPAEPFIIKVQTNCVDPIKENQK